ncbi:MAG TPA: glycerol-3-phosphate dehydrogenase C-terminal domain-containing protein, partial [Gemmatimonadaceae bacterium]
ELEPFVERFVREVALAWPSRELTRESVLLVHAGMQPSPHGSAAAAAHGPPEHQLIDHAQSGVPQLLTAIGPKLTMARAIAEQLTDSAAARLGRPTTPCDTASVPLHSAPPEDIPGMISRAVAAHETALPDDVIAHLVCTYGSGDGYAAIVEMVRGDAALAARVDATSPVILAQLRYAALFEHATRAEDIVMRRTELGATAHVPPSALLAAQHAIELGAAAGAAKGGAQELRADSLRGARGSRSL